MGVREVAFELRTDHFLCETTDEADVETVCLPDRSLDGEPAHLLHVIGVDDARQDLRDELDRQIKTVEFAEGDRFETYAVHHEASRATLTGPLAVVRETLPGSPVLRPFTAEGGRILARLLVPSRLDDGDVVQELRAAAEDEGWADWRLLHLTEHHPGAAARKLGDERLSTKQLEVVKMALALGYFDSPRGCTLETLSQIFDISKAAIHNRLKAAERKILAEYLA